MVAKTKCFCELFLPTKTLLNRKWEIVRYISCPCVGELRILSQDLSSGTSMNLRSSFHLFAIIILSSGLAKLRTFASPSHNGAKFSLMKLHQNFYSPKVLGDSHFLSFFDKKTSPLITDYLLAFSVTVDCHH